MNDFTEEELIALKNGIDYLPERINLSKQYQEMCNCIVSKLSFMIDNYCEHDWVHSYREKEFDVCSKCGNET